MTDDTPSETELDVIEGMEALVEDQMGGAVIDLLPRTCDDTVALGLSVAVDALRNKDKQVAKASLETVVAELDDQLDTEQDQ